MKKLFLENLKKLNINNKKILLAISGGKDSICMLDLFFKVKEELSLELVVCHFNHLIRANSTEDENFVRELAKGYGLKFYSKRVDVISYSKENRVTVEEGARTLRYDFFEEVKVKENINFIATAHNKEDNAETVLMRIFRGTGIAGLCGIPERTENIIRPLLIFDVESIKNYVKENNLKIVEDYTNELDIYNRNKIRLNVIPNIRENFNENIIDALNRLSVISKQYINVIDVVISEKQGYLYDVISKGRDVSFKVNIEKLKTENVDLRCILYRYFYEKVNKSTEGINFEFIESVDDLLNSKTGKYLRIKDVVFERVYDFLYVYKYEEVESDTINFENLKYSLYSTKFFDIIIGQSNFEEFTAKKSDKNIFFINEKYLEKMKIRSRKNGDFIELNFGKKKIKDIFIDEKIDKNLRDSIPIFEIDGEVIWIANIRRSKNYLLDKNCPISKIEVIRRENENFR